VSVYYNDIPIGFKTFKSRSVMYRSSHTQLQRRKSRSKVLMPHMNAYELIEIMSAKLDISRCKELKAKLPILLPCQSFGDHSLPVRASFHFVALTLYRRKKKISSVLAV